MTITGVRKTDYPQSFSYHTPWWPYYKSLNQYFARLSYVLSQGSQKNDILVIEPTTTAWMYTSTPKLSEIGINFQSFVTMLEKSQVEYDLGSENIIKDHGKAAQGKFITGNRAYSMVVIPPGMENIDGPTFRLLKQFAAGGGKVILFEKLQTLDGSYQKELEYFNHSAGNVLQFVKPDQLLINRLFRSPDFRLTGNGSDAISGNLYHHRRLLNDGQLIFLSNASMDSAAAGHLTARGKDALLMDLFTGEITDFPERQEKDGKLSVDFDLPAAGSMLLFISNKKQQGFTPCQVSGLKAVINSGTTKTVRPLVNTLMIDFCDLSLGNILAKDIHTSEATKKVFTFYGFGKNPWDHQMQFKDQFVARDTFSRGTGFTAAYHFVISNQVNYKNFKAVVEQPELWATIAVNGQPVKPSADWWLDKSFGVLEIGNYLHPGDNTLSVTANPMSVYAEIESIYILGDFNLKSSLKGWQIEPPGPLKQGSWKDQGLPMYGQQVSYTREFVLNEINKQYEVQVGEWKGTVCAVKVNDIPAGIIIAQPNTLNITSYLKTGSNKVEVIIVGSLKNLLGPHHNSPKPGMVGPGNWSNIKSYPPGDNYQLYDYGLMDDFKIMAL
jgi:hypothetical protein